MISSLCLVACAKTKQAEENRAENLYISPLFRKHRQFARQYCDKWYILSAEYGLLEPHQIIRPYNKTLKTMSERDRKQWARAVFQDLRQRLHKGDTVTVLAGASYRKNLMPLLVSEGYETRAPLAGRSLGVQMKWLNSVNSHRERLAHLAEFYRLLKKLEQGLGGKRVLNQSTGHLHWPRRGVYFLFEPEEKRIFDGAEQRVVRVGSHMVSRGSKATLWNRLRTHRGTDDGRGNHRGSVFRLHVGAAILARDHREDLVPTWGTGSIASASIRETEAELERAVSSYIGRMSLLWLNVPDEAGPASDRAYVERNCISLLSGACGPVDLPSHGWLGNHSPNKRVADSGLWNVAFTDYRYDTRFLGVLEYYVDVTLGTRPEPRVSIAPSDWQLTETGKASMQLRLVFKEDSDDLE